MHRRLDRLLQRVFRGVVSSDDARAWVGRELRGWEKPLPSRFRRRARLLSRERMRDVHLPVTSHNIFFVQQPDALQLLAQVAD